MVLATIKLEYLIINPLVYNSTLVIDIPSQLPSRPSVITVSRTARIIRHIPEAKSSEITYLAYFIYCFGNCKNKVIISDHQSAG